MPDRLEVCGKGGTLSFELAAGLRYTVGRGADADCRVDGEPFLSRRHVEVFLTGRQLQVRKLPQAVNPVYYAGAQKEDLVLEPGETFIIGETSFRFMAEKEGALPEPADQEPEAENIMGSSEVYAVSDRLRLKDLLELPEILRTKERKDFYAHIAGVLRLATGAQLGAIVSWDGTGHQVLGRDTARDNDQIALSSKLMAKAVATRPGPVFYSWRRPTEGIQATVCEGADWAICAAVDVTGGKQVLFYAAGFGGPSSARNQVNLDNTRYVGLVADMVGRSLSVQRLEEWGTRLQRFFAKRVVEKLLDDKDLTALEPKIAESTALFFDIRGFSKLTEEFSGGAAGEIMKFHWKLREVMTAMTDEILKAEGVVLQYMGDGILACWNVPCPDPAHIDRACQAALRMTKRLSEVDPQMRCGIGIHTGAVVAGTIGSEQLFTYGVLGAVINQASRVEGITKILGTPIIATRAVAERLSPQSGVAATPLGTFQPAGMTVALDLYELTAQPADQERLKTFTAAVAAIKRGAWAEAAAALRPLPAEDSPARYLASLAGDCLLTPPQNWNGVIKLSAK